MIDDQDSDLDRELRRALRAVDPEIDVAARVAARLGAGPPRAARHRWRPRHWLPVAVAASLLAAIGLHGWQVRQDERALEARRQLIEALRVTSQKLDIAYHAVNDASADERPGA